MVVGTARIRTLAGSFFYLATGGSLSKWLEISYDVGLRASTGMSRIIKLNRRLRMWGRVFSTVAEYSAVSL
jgi:hypothetical protein